MLALNLAFIVQIFQFAIFGSKLPNNPILRSIAYSSSLLSTLPDTRGYHQPITYPVISSTIIDIKPAPMYANMKILFSDCSCNLHINTDLYLHKNINIVRTSIQIKSKNIMVRFVKNNDENIEYSNIITNTKNILYNVLKDNIIFDGLVKRNYTIKSSLSDKNTKLKLFKNEKQIIKTNISSSSFSSMMTKLCMKYDRQNYTVEFGTKALANFFEKRLDYSTQLGFSIPLSYPKLTELDLNYIMPFSLLEDGKMTNVTIYVSSGKFQNFIESDNEKNNYHGLHRLVNKKIIEGNINEFRKHEKYSIWKKR